MTSAPGPTASQPSRRLPPALWLILLSIPFLLAAITKALALPMPVVHRPAALIPAIIFLCGGFQFEALAWWRTACPNRPYRLALASAGLTIFGKYLPGKIWMAIGRAEYLKVELEETRLSLSARSLQLQFVILWTGLAIGAVAALLTSQRQLLGPLTWSVLFGLTVTLFCDAPRRWVEALASRILRRNLTLPLLNGRTLARLVPWSVLAWASWSLGLHFLLTAISPDAVSPAAAAGFAAATTFGMLAVIVPGGIGVREGILVAWFIAVGIPVEIAATAALTQRLWFLIGECLFFGTGLLAGHRRA